MSGARLERAPPNHAKTVLLDDLRNATGADRAATLADSEAQALFLSLIHISSRAPAREKLEEVVEREEVLA